MKIYREISYDYGKHYARKEFSEMVRISNE